MLIIDAFNVLHAAPQLPRRGPGKTHRLTLQTLARLIAQGPVPAGVSGTPRGHVALLVCDGTAAGLARHLSDQSEHGPGLSVRYMFAGPGKEADAVIEQLLDEQAQRGLAAGCLVVSSDRRVQAAAKGVRAKVMPAAAFLALLVRVSSARSPTPEQVAPDKPVGRLDPESTRWWLRFFGFAEDTSAGAASAPRPTVQPAPPEQPPQATVPVARRSGPAENPVDETARALSGLQSWSAEFRLDDLDMAQWLDEPTTPAPPIPSASQRDAEARASDRSRRPKRRR